MPRNIYILCGGASTRMGTDKALLELDNQTLLNRMWNRCFDAGFASCYLLSGTLEHGNPEDHIPDYLPDAGPLGGVAGALDHTADSDIALIPVDMPMVKHTTLSFLAQNPLPKNIDALVGADEHRLHPLIGIYASSLLPSLQNFLNRGERSVRGFLKNTRLKTFNLSLDETLNVNRPEDFEHAINQSDKYK